MIGVPTETGSVTLAVKLTVGGATGGGGEGGGAAGGGPTLTPVDEMNCPKIAAKLLAVTIIHRLSTELAAILG